MNQPAMRGLVTNIVFVRLEVTRSTVVSKAKNGLSTQLAQVSPDSRPNPPRLKLASCYG
jgi:hypothetical protein